MNARMIVIALCFLAGCTDPANDKAAKNKLPAKPASESKKVEVGKNVTLEIMPDGKRRVIVPAEVCFREGPLEMFMCRKLSKEHESVVAADIDARDLHKALTVAGAIAGSPARFEPKYEPAKGSIVKITVKYEKDGKEISTDARNWVQDFSTKKALDKDWVFGGSFFFPDQTDPTKPEKYAANSGDVVCVSNFGTAMMDLPIQSSSDNEDLMFQAFTEHIPPLGTKVTLIFEPQEEKKDSDKAKDKPKTK